MSRGVADRVFRAPSGGVTTLRFFGSARTEPLPVRLSRSTRANQKASFGLNRSMAVEKGQAASRIGFEMDGGAARNTSLLVGYPPHRRTRFPDPAARVDSVIA